MTMETRSEERGGAPDTSIGGARDWGGPGASFLAEVRTLGLPSGPGSSDPVGEEDLVALPVVVRRYLRFMGVVGRPRDWSLRAALQGRFRLGPERRWLPFEAWQYNSAVDIARVFHLRLKMGGVLPVLARDTYLGGCGRLRVRLFDRVTFAEATGPEYDLGELVTWLNDAILLAPSMLLRPATTWTGVDDRSFDVSLSDRVTRVTARVYLDERGAPVGFSTEDRYCEDPFSPRHPLIRGRWTTPVDGWTMRDGRALPTSARAEWHLPGGRFEYIAVRSFADGLTFNVTPGR